MLIARFAVATSSARECSGSSTAITLCPAFCRIGITPPHEDASAHAPWTRTIFTFVAFVAIPCNPLGCIKVLFWALARPECAYNERVTTTKSKYQLYNCTQFNATSKTTEIVILWQASNQDSDKDILTEKLSHGTDLWTVYQQSCRR